MKRIIFASSVLLGFCSLLLVNACTKSGNTNLPTIQKPNLPASVDDYVHVNTSGNFLMNLTFKSGKTAELSDLLMFTANSSVSVTNEGATLGRVLFYDKVMSLNNSIACASCHHQSKAFSDGVASSEGFAGKFTPRNSMSIVNPLLNNNMFWDSRTPSVRDLTLQPVFNHLEMGMESMEKLVSKIKAVSYYPALFQKAYGSEEITGEKISDALSQFLCAMISGNSKFDKAEEVNFSNFNALEKRGFELFFSAEAKCSQCHAGANFSAPDGAGGDYGAPEVAGTANIGLDKVYKDNGKNNGQFRIPSLRNIALTAPYMHDGRFTSLDQVVEHYNSGVQNHKNLDKKLKDSFGNPQRLNLTETDKLALVAFLKTLTDESLLTDKKFSDPFTK